MLERRITVIRSAQDALQPLEAVERHGRVCSGHGGAGFGGNRSQDGHDRRDLPQGASHGLQPAVEIGGVVG